MNGSAGGRGKELGPEDFDAIRDAVMETPRGRWFLGEFENRLRRQDTASVLESVKRLEEAVSHSHDAIMQHLAEALARGPLAGPSPQPGPQPDLAPRHMKYFRQDEDIFEPAPQATIAAVPDAPQKQAEAKPAVQKGAKLIIRRTGEAAAAEVLVEAAPVPEAPPAEAPVAEAMLAPRPELVEPPQPSEPKRRIVIIRHKPGEDIEVPLQNEMAEAS